VCVVRVYSRASFIAALITHLHRNLKTRNLKLNVYGTSTLSVTNLPESSTGVNHILDRSARNILDILPLILNVLTYLIISCLFLEGRVTSSLPHKRRREEKKRKEGASWLVYYCFVYHYSFSCILLYLSSLHLHLQLDMYQLPPCRMLFMLLLMFVDKDTSDDDLDY